MRELDYSEHDFEQGDRLVLLDPRLVDQVGAEAFTACVGAPNLRSGMDELRQLLQDRELGEAVLVLEPSASAELISAPLELSFQPDATATPDSWLGEAETRDALEHTWRLYRGVHVERSDRPYSSCSLEWLDAVRRADTAELKPRDGDLLQIFCKRCMRGRPVHRGGAIAKSWHVETAEDGIEVGGADRCVA